MSDVIDRWKSEERFCQEKLVSNPDFDIADHYYRKHIGWLELIKTIRALTGASLVQAQTVALRHRGWRKWIEKRIRSDPRCAKEARLYVRDVGSSPFLVIDESQPKVRNVRKFSLFSV